PNVIRPQVPPPREEPKLVPVNGIVQPPVIPPPNRPGRRTNVLEELKSVLNCLWRTRWSHHFRHPVDAVVLAVPDYHVVITHPMDLGTVKKRLQNNYYWQAQEAIDDIELIFDNCRLYNLPGSTVHQAGGELQNVFKSKLAMLDLENEHEIQGKADKRKKRSATDDIAASYLASMPPMAPSGVSHYMPGLVPQFPYVQTGPSLIPHTIPNFPGFMPGCVPDTLINPLVLAKPELGHSMKTRRDTEVKPPPSDYNVLSALPPLLTRGPIEMPPSPPPAPPQAPEEVEPPKPDPVTPVPVPVPSRPALPPVVSYKELDWQIDKKHALHALKAMMKRKRKPFTWAFNNHELWVQYGSLDYDFEKEEALDWKILEEHVNDDKYEDFDAFVCSVRKMFQNALRCFPDDSLVKNSVKKSNEIFERRLPKYREGIARAKENARLMLAEKERELARSGDL
ncbi:hypothetical protein KR018_009402, partial [Drosophila ironensis]